MKNKLFFIVFISYATLTCCSRPGQKEYFVRPVDFVCDYTFNDTTKWAITCRVWGLLKYHHPNITAGKLDWDKILLDRLEDIYYSSTPEMVNAELKKMLDSAGKYTYKEDNKWNDSLNMNVNLCWLDNSFLNKDLRDELKKIASMTVKYPSHYGISPKTMIPQNEKTYDKFTVDTSLSSLKLRLLLLFRYWNIIYYFFPHKYIMEQSWDIALTQSIMPFIEAGDNQAYEIAFLKLATTLNDGHGYIDGYNSYSYNSHDIIEIIDGKTVVRTDFRGLYKGDIITSVGHRNITEIRDSLTELIPASTVKNKEYRINCMVADMILLHETEVTITRDDQSHILNLPPGTREYKIPTVSKRINENIGYVNLPHLTTNKMDSIFQTFSDTKGIIFDLRKTGPKNYDVRLFESYLSDKKIASLFQIIFSDPEHPGAFGIIKNLPEILADKDIPETSRYKGKIVYLINENSQSFAETQAWVGQNFFDATLIGRPTSGALGHIVRIPLPQRQANFSGLGLFSPDGEQLQRKGIIPDIEVYPTMESIKAGKDEVLEAAIEFLNDN